jgi:hypothetical protein
LGVLPPVVAFLVFIGANPAVDVARTLSGPRGRA